MIALKVLLLREDKQEEADSYPCAPCCSSFLESQGTISMVDGSTKIKKRLVRSKPFSGTHKAYVFWKMHQTLTTTRKYFMGGTGYDVSSR